MRFINRKISLGAAIGLIAIAITLTISVTLGAVNSSYNNILQGLPEKLNRYSTLDELGGIIGDEFYGQVDSERLQAALADGYVRGLDDSFSEFMTADEYETYLSETQGNMSGIGIEVTQGKSGIYVEKVYSGSPAKTAGLKVGDRIVAFDGEAVSKTNYKQMAEKLTGGKLTTVNMTYRRDNVEKNVSVVKGYEAKSVSSAIYDGIGYVSVASFFSSTASRVQDAIDKFKDSKVSGIVVDVRGNSSTNMEEALKTLDIFIPMVEGASGIATLVDANGEVLSTYASTAGEVNIPVAVLIDEETSGAAEFFACELRDFEKAKLVGTTTAGMGLAQEVFRLTDGSAVRLTVGQIVPFRSESYHSIGVVPDYVSENEGAVESIEEDSVYLYAVSVIKPQEEE